MFAVHVFDVNYSDNKSIKEIVILPNLNQSSERIDL
ncbi:MAG: hypothetical protein GAK29_02049 [Acinetobacter bereziniae]|uniref:Uncharacterized protein n=1 Tax=Acinetobacter bereziniae TaxID=106648 RepID=A0A833UPH3_ACIBZ|nr:MAG: hypothetical protein GAK29_02049 [Acinetobacter bereziniae]